MTPPAGAARHAAAGLIAALAAAAGYPLYYFGVCVWLDKGNLGPNAQAAAFIFAYAVVVAAVHVVALGLPVVLLLRRYGAFTLRNLLIAGFLAGAIPLSFLDIRFAPWTGLYGLIGAGAFWRALDGGASSRHSHP